MLVLQSPTFSQTEGVLLLQDTLYDPFRRHDAYGCMGQGPLPLRESMRLALAAVFVLPVKVRPPDAACKALGWPQHGCLHSLPLLSKRQVASPACAGCAFFRACLDFWLSGYWRSQCYLSCPHNMSAYPRV